MDNLNVLEGCKENWGPENDHQSIGQFLKCLIQILTFF